MDQNRVRDHLANERTFLAWVRTALGMIGLGFVLARMGLFLRQLAVTAAATGFTDGAKLNAPRGLHAGHEFLISGVVFLAIGTVLGALSAWLYDRNRRAIDAGSFAPALRSILALTAVVVVGSLAIIGLVVWRVIVEG
jgi:putative membrane protein